MSKCFFHNADLDGQCSGAIIQLANPGCDLIGIDYGDQFPWNIVQKNETVYMVDFSLPIDQMIKLNKMCNLHWIDHHISKIKEANEHNFIASGGQLLDTKKAACELSWEYLFPTLPMPMGVYLLGRYDVWDHTNPKTLPFQYGMRLYETDPEIFNFDWKILHQLDKIEQIIKNGKLFLQYEEKQNQKYCNACAFETELDGFKCLAINKMLTNSQLFESLWDNTKFDVMLTFGFRNGSWTVSLYTDKDGIDVSIVAKNHNGGGHKQAAGFVCDTLPFDLK